MKKLSYILILFAASISVMVLSCSPSETIYVTEVDTLTLPSKDTVVIEQPINQDSVREIYQPFAFNFAVQIGSFDNESYAKSFTDKAKEALNITVDVLWLENKYCVCIGSFDNLAKAEAYQKYVQSKGYPEAFIRRK